MTRPWQGPRLLLAVVGALVALSCQSKRRTFILVYEVPVSDPVVVTTMEFLTEDFNKKNEDLYNFRIVRVLKAMKRVCVPPLPSCPSLGICGFRAAMQVNSVSFSPKWVFQETQKSPGADEVESLK